VATKPRLKTEEGKRGQETHPLSCLCTLKNRVPAPARGVPGRTGQKPVSTHFCKPRGLLRAPTAGQGSGSWQGGARSPSPVAGVISIRRDRVRRVKHPHGKLRRGFVSSHSLTCKSQLHQRPHPEENRTRPTLQSALGPLESYSVGHLTQGRKLLFLRASKLDL